MTDRIESPARPHGDTTTTLAIPRVPSGAALTVAEVASIDAFAFAAGDPLPFWERRGIATSDLMSDAGFDETGWPYSGKPTFRHVLPYGEGSPPYLPPFGDVRLYFVLHLTAGGRMTIEHATTYLHSAPTSGGHV